MNIMKDWGEIFLKILDGRNDINKNTDARVLDRAGELCMALGVEGPGIWLRGKKAKTGVR